MLLRLLIAFNALFLPATQAIERTPLDLAVSPVDCNQNLVQREDFRQQIRLSFLDHFAPMKFTTRGQNREVMALALLENPTHEFILKENAVMKFLNTENDKDLVTAMTNFHNFLYIQEFKRLLPGIEYKMYADFKGLLFALPKPAPAGLSKILEQVMKEADRRFYESAILTQIVRRGDLGNVMFKSAKAGRDVIATWIAHLARKSDGNFLSADDPDVLETLNADLTKFKNLHANLMTQFQGTSMVEDGKRFALSVFALARKYTEPSALRRHLRLTFPGLNSRINLQTAKDILAYAGLANDFSPTPLIEKRGEISIQESRFGTIALDFLGLGAENLRATADALAAATDLNNAAFLVRLGERQVTRDFEARKASVIKILQQYARELLEEPMGAHDQGPALEIDISGDDAYIRIQRKLVPGGQLKLLSVLSDLFKGPYLRMTFIADNIKTEDVSEAIGHAENMEKKMRELVRETMGARFADNMQIEFYLPDGGTVRDVYLYMNFYETTLRGRTISRSFEESEKVLIRSAFHAAVAYVQSGLQGVTYRPGPDEFGRHSRIRDKFYRAFP